MGWSIMVHVSPEPLMGVGAGKCKANAITFISNPYKQRAKHKSLGYRKSSLFLSFI